MATTSYSRVKQTGKRLLKCFCGCTDLTEDEVKHIYRLGAQETLTNSQALKLFRSFLNYERSGDPSETEQFLNVYELTERLKYENQLLNDNGIDELCECGLRYDKEKLLKKAIESGNKCSINSCLINIQEECKNEIEISLEYYRFKQAILDKLRRPRT